MKIEPRTLQQRTLLFILLPTFLLLVILLLVGFVFVRDMLHKQWGEAAVYKLERSANLIDIRLGEPKRLLMLLQDRDDSTVNRRLVNHIAGQIEELDGVVKVTIAWPEQHLQQAEKNGLAPDGPIVRSGQLRLKRFDVSSPKYDNSVNDRTISMVSEIKSISDATVGRVEVIISFDALIGPVINAPWWKSNKAYILDGENNVLASTGLELGLEDFYPMRAFGTMSVLESDTVLAMQNNLSGTVFGPGKPPEEISGFYRLSEAPWTMVIIAPGDKALSPIIQFRRLYFLSFAGCILLVLVFIRVTMNQVTIGIKKISVAADDLANGKFGDPLEVTTRDEVGELTGNFNKMTRQLRHRLELKEAINIAREVQQNLLPREGYSGDRIEISGFSIYCDETGGDYFDILQFPESDGKVGVVVGDVVGHGVGAALLMTTVRALVRSRLSQPGGLDQVMNDVNRLLYQDTVKSGSFVTLFYLEYDQFKSVLRWVRAGHDPAIIYAPAEDSFSELKGKGMALGVDLDWRYECNEISIGEETKLILIGSDGVWEVENGSGEQFGKERVKEIFAAQNGSHPDIIVKNIIGKIAAFRGDTPQADDITLAVIKVG
ncbi:MAG: SpoIIE family protein phosphatase [Deltaproteobacteria bacterium]|nr:SpoIIE family protein phosphatase [Deltaproteobacteria bacterium]